MFLDSRMIRALKKPNNLTADYINHLIQEYNAVEIKCEFLLKENQRLNELLRTCQNCEHYTLFENEETGDKFQACSTKGCIEKEYFKLRGC